MRFYLAADHNGFELKSIVADYLKKQGYDVEDDGDAKYDPEDDFPIFASRAAHRILTSDDPDPRGIFICGSGQGMVIAANRIKGIRAGLGWSREAAQSIRNDEDCNVLALPSQLHTTDPVLVLNIIEDFIKTPFARATRFSRRIKELDTL